ncbi:hypothetical protein [Wenzhouxiangella limi]|uniref:Uncharacterized protein n=1 Tax=Wenzhouxiangella limi TaxID=2707351 RepID=A0A845UWC8_9GAMM|nr:hypothetical protein [Wenzhouxiangella limi]NDY94908.1 hypothetical protein [Wenzhouxiangella limi]
MSCLHNHGTIGVGDTFTEGENLQFAGIPSFAPELLAQERHPEITFRATREVGVYVDVDQAA